MKMISASAEMDPRASPPIGKTESKFVHSVALSIVFNDYLAQTSLRPSPRSFKRFDVCIKRFIEVDIVKTGRNFESHLASRCYDSMQLACFSR
jgi:hypothetical protein